MADDSIMKEEDFIFAERPKTMDDRLRLLKALLVNWEAVEVKGEGIGGAGFWGDYLNGAEGKEIEDRLASFLHENKDCAEYYLSSLKEQGMDFPYTAKLTKATLETAYGKDSDIQFAVLPEDEPTTCFNGAFHVTSVGGIPKTDDVFIFAEDKNGNPYAYTTDFAFRKEDRLTTKNPDAYSTLERFGFDVTLDAKTIGKEEQKPDIPTDLQAYKEEHPESFPNPEAFQTEWFEEGYGPTEGLTTFVCHEETQKGSQYYLAGYPITGYDEEPVVEAGMMLPVSPDILKLAPEERDKVAAELDERIFLPLRRKSYSAAPYERISDPDIRAVAEKEDKKIAKELFGDGERYADKYDAYYRKLANALLDHENPKFGIERIAAAIEQAAPVCHNYLHECRTTVHDTKYAIQMLDDVLRERGASKDEQEALAAYKKTFHAKKNSLDDESRLENFFCKSASKVDIANGLSARLTKTNANEPIIQIAEMTQEKSNAADRDAIPLNSEQSTKLNILRGRLEPEGKESLAEKTMREVYTSDASASSYDDLNTRAVAKLQQMGASDKTIKEVAKIAKTINPSIKDTKAYTKQLTEQAKALSQKKDRV